MRNIMSTHSPRRPQSKSVSARIAISAVGALVAMSVIPAAAQSREQRQMMADLRILQEQTQVLQNILGSITEAIKAVNARIDEQANASAKALADQKLIIDNVTNTVREIREKLDDNSVRLGSLTDEVDALRQALEQLNTAPPPVVDPALTPGPGAPGTPDPAATAVPPAAAPSSAPPVAVPLGTSPQKLFDEARSDYFIGQYALAIAGFENVIKVFPKSERAADAQLHIGHSYLNEGKYENAVEAYELAIRNYPTAPGVPEAYQKKGVALRSLKRNDEARAAFEYVIKTYPESTAATLARQGLAQLATQK
jgi:tol-pal system protein YbgF